MGATYQFRLVAAAALACIFFVFRAVLREPTGRKRIGGAEFPLRHQRERADH